MDKLTKPVNNPAGAESELNVGLGVISPDAMQDLINWLCRHEEDIELGINDFADLKQVFVEVLGRNAGDIIEAEPIW